MQGACGYGMLNKEVYPYWSAAALSTSSQYYKDPVQGCGWVLLHCNTECGGFDFDAHGTGIGAG